MRVPDVLMFSKFISNTDKGKSMKTKRRRAKDDTCNKIPRPTPGIINTVHSLWICVAMLLHMVSKTMVAAVCTPVNGTDLSAAVKGCLKETPDGSCPLFANKARDSVGCNNDAGANGVVGDWDVSQVTDMTKVFHYQNSFNADISKWDTSKVTDLSLTFRLASKFNGDLSKWETSQVTTMDRTFAYASVFNSDLSKWETSQVTTMRWMFNGASAFNSDLSKWMTSSVTNMYGLFHSASLFNSDLAAWDTNSATTMNYSTSLSLNLVYSCSPL